MGRRRQRTGRDHRHCRFRHRHHKPRICRTHLQRLNRPGGQPGAGQCGQRSWHDRGAGRGGRAQWRGGDGHGL
jgi:hypothetical protein